VSVVPNSTSIDIAPILNNVTIVTERGDPGIVLELKNPEFSYTDGLLSRILYSGGETKVISYLDGLISQVVFDNGSTVVTKTFNYIDDVLISVSEV
jgi:hypothetical protein